MCYGVYRDREKRWRDISHIVHHYLLRSIYLIQGTGVRQSVLPAYLCGVAGTGHRKILVEHFRVVKGRNVARPDEGQIVQLQGAPVEPGPSPAACSHGRRRVGVHRERKRGSRKKRAVNLHKRQGEC